MSRAVVVAVVVALVSAGCTVSGVAFRRDERLRFVSPDDRSEVTLPITIEWEVDDFDGSYAVFVDRAPQPPGKTLEWLARDDDACHRDDGCPDSDWFAERDVHPTSATSFTIEQLPAESSDRREFHEVTVVLIGDDGRRVAETGWTLEFQVNREGR